MCERKARCVTTTYLFLFFCFDSDEEWPISSTECWVVKLSYGHKVRSWKGLKVERKQRSESGLYIRKSGSERQETQHTGRKTFKILTWLKKKFDIPPFIKHLVPSSKSSLHVVLFWPVSLLLPRPLLDSPLIFFPFSSHHPSWLLPSPPLFHPPSLLSVLSSIYHSSLFPSFPIRLPAFHPARRS